MVNIKKRDYYLNLFSGNAVITVANSKNVQFAWTIRDLNLTDNTEIGLVQLVQTNAVSTTTYCFRIRETYADGWDSYNETSAIIYMGNGMIQPSIPVYHKLIGNNLNQITLTCTDDITTNTASHTGINTTIVFGFILHIISYDNLSIS